MPRLRVLFTTLAIFFTLPLLTSAQSPDIGTFSGTVFGDYYWMVSHHNDGLEGANGFRFRRIYFTHEYKLGQDFSTRLRLEMENPGDYQTQSSMFPSVKDAYLKWKPGKHSFYLGISKSPTWTLVEDAWGYRPIEQSPLDLQGYGSSRGFGLAVRGPLSVDGTFRYHAMFSNGGGTASEINKGKKAMLSVGYYADSPLVIELYGDINFLPGQTRSTAQIFAGYRSEDFTAGGLFAYQTRDYDNPLRETDHLPIASLFTHFPVSENLTTVFRADHTFAPNPGGESIDYMPFSNRADATFLIAGLDFKPYEEVNVHLMPNIETIFYNDLASFSSLDLPEPDLQAKLTFSYGF